MRNWLAEPVWFRLQERLKGHDTLRILKDMEAADRLSADELRQLQCRRLQAFVAACFQHVPYLRRRMQEAHLEPRDIRDLADLRLLPLLTKTRRA